TGRNIFALVFVSTWHHESVQSLGRQHFAQFRHARLANGRIACRIEGLEHEPFPLSCLWRMTVFAGGWTGNRLRGMVHPDCPKAGCDEGSAHHVTASDAMLPSLREGACECNGNPPPYRLPAPRPPVGQGCPTE